MPPHLLPMYEQQGRWLVQRKFNGSRTVVHVTPAGEVTLWGREGDAHEFEIPHHIAEEIRSLNLLGQEYWLDGEFMHRTTAKQYKNKLILFDVLQAGRYFFLGPKLTDRLLLLDEICRSPKSLETSGRGIALAVTENIWMAQSWKSSFSDRFNDLIDMPEIEGLVVKLADSVLRERGLRYYEVEWQIRCRKESKSYRY
jgi:ATP-dependent DNA ligase